MKELYVALLSLVEAALAYDIIDAKAKAELLLNAKDVDIAASNTNVVDESTNDALALEFGEKLLKIIKKEDIQ